MLKRKKEKLCFSNHSFYLLYFQSTSKVQFKEKLKFFHLPYKLVMIIAIGFLLSALPVLANQPPDEYIVFDSSEDYAEILKEEEVNLLLGKGSFEVSGEPSSFAVAWIDNAIDLISDEQNQKNILHLAIFEENQIPFSRQISGDVDASEKIFLKKDHDRIVVCWKGSDGWHLGILERLTSHQAYQETFYRLDSEGFPLAFALNEYRLAIMMIPERKASRWINEKKGESGKQNDPEIISFPAFQNPALFEIDLKTFESKIIYQFTEKISSASLSHRDSNWTMALAESVSKKLQYLEVDSEGNPVIFHFLNYFPVKEISSQLKELGSNSVIGWIEEREEKNVAILGLLSREESSSSFTVKEISSQEAQANNIILSEGAGLWVSWDEQVEANHQLKIAALDVNGNPTCLSKEDHEITSSKTWILESGQETLLINQRQSSEGKESLTIKYLYCQGLKKSNEFEQESDTSILEPEPTPFQQSVQESLLSGAEDPCDGYDNDGDGTIDNGCDLTCDSPEKLGSDERITNDLAGSYSPSLVQTWTGYGVSWHDYRDGNHEIYFARLNSSGRMIGSDVRVTNDGSDSGYSSLAWSGSEYGISWRDDRDGNHEIYFARLDSSGTKVDPPGDVRVTNNSSSSLDPSLVWSGSEYGVSWHDDRDGNTEIYFARVDSSGNKIGSDVRVTYDSSSSSYPSLAWTGSNYGLSWHDDRDGIYDEIYFARLDSSGTKVDPPGDIRVTNDPSSSSYPSLAWTGSEYGIAWVDWRNFNYEIYFTRLDSSGTKIDPPGDIRVTNNDSSSDRPSLVWSGSEYGLSWYDQRDGNQEIYFARVNSSGSKIGSDIRVTNDASNSVYSSLVWSGSEYGISYRDHRNGNYEIYVSQIRCCDDEDGDGYSECAGDSNDVDPGINPGAIEICDGKDNDSDGSTDEGCDQTCDSPEKYGSDVRVTSNAAYSFNSSLAWSGNGYGISWEDRRDGNYEIYFARLDSSGNKVGSDKRVTNYSSTSEVPSLVWNGSEYGVSWQDWRDANSEVYFARLDPSGNKIGSDVRVTSNAASSYYPSLVWSGSEYGVSWHDDRDGNTEIYFARLDSSGNKIGSDVRVTNDASSSYEPSLVWSGSEYGVSWGDQRDGNREIYFARLDSSGNRIGADIRVTEDPASSNNSSLVWSGSGYGMSWLDGRDSNSEIYFTLLDSSGNKIGSDVRVTYDSSSSNVPFLVWTGSEYGLSWDDSRDGNREIYFARLDSLGSKIGTDIRMTNDASNSYNVPLVWSGNEYAVSWEDQRDGNPEIYFTQIRCCDDMDSDGYSECAGDSNDADPEINPDATEICDGRDNNSDGSIDEGCDSICDSSEKLGSDERITNALEDSYHSSLIWTGSEYGVSWYDDRDGNDEIYFARLDSSGNKISADVRVTNDASYSYSPSLIWSGSEYGVSWRDYRDGNYEIYFARLDSSGTKIGSDVRVTNGASNSLYPSLIWSGSEYGVSWEDYRDGNGEIYFARLDSSGNKIGSDTRVTWESSISQRVSLIWSGSEYGVSWEDNRDGNGEIYFARLDSSGNKIGSDVRVTNATATSNYPSLIWTGSEYGVSWRDNRGGNYEIYFARLDSSGTKVDPPGDVRVTNDSSHSLNPSLVWSGSEYGLSWYDQRDGNQEIYFARLNSFGIKIDSDLRLTNDSAISQFPSLVWTGSEYSISWNENRVGNHEIYLAQIICCGNDFDGDTYGDCDDCDHNDADIYPGASQICDGKNNDCNDLNWPALTGTNEGDDDSDNYSECQGDCNDGEGSIYPGAPETCGDGTDNDCDGSTDESTDNDSDGHYSITSCLEPHDDCNDSDGSIYPGATEICNGYDDNCDSSLDEGCDAACDNPEKSGSDVRVTNDSFSSFSVSLIWHGDGYGVSWSDGRDDNDGDGTDEYEIYFARLDSSGNKIGSDMRVTNYSSWSLNPSLVWSGSEYGVSWQDDRENFYYPEIYFARLDSSGTKIGSDVRVTNDASGSYEPTLVWSGSEYGVSWYDIRDGNYEVYFARLDSSGSKIGSDVRVTNDDSNSYSPSLVWNGSEYGISWDDSRNGGWSEIYFARLDSSGNKIGSDVRVTYDPCESKSSSLVWRGSEYGISWIDSRHDCYLFGLTEIYFARLDSSGTKLGADVRVTYDGSSYNSGQSLVWSGSEYGISWVNWYGDWEAIYFARLNEWGNKIGTEVLLWSPDSDAPSLVWSGREYGISWHDEQDGNSEIYFNRVRCCDDVDLDTFTECEDDCNDNDADVYPGATEICDYKDNNCDGTIDEGYITPGGTTGLVFASDKQTMNWDVEINADYYDLVKGDLQTLISSGGNFETSLTSCHENDLIGTSASDTAEPTSPGEGFYYLVRAQTDCRHGTYNTGQASQTGDRDTEIDASTNKCP